MRNEFEMTRRHGIPAIIVHCLLPYHVARLRAARRSFPLCCIELSAASSEYAGVPSGGQVVEDRATVFSTGDSRDRTPSTVRKRVHDCLEEIRPSLVAVNGWADWGALAALEWCLRNAVPAVLLSDSLPRERPRMLAEAWKRRVVAMVKAAFVAGEPHARYLERLGLPSEAVFQGYDVVDNDHFAAGAAAARARESAERARLGLPGRYLLTPARHIREKNLERLLRAFAKALAEPVLNGGCLDGGCMNLVLAGDGPLTESLRALAETLGIAGRIAFKGPIPYCEMPAYYGLAEGLILPSISETWGLVVNEAAAAGLPLAVSRACGCVQDLVRDGENGLLLDPFDLSSMTGAIRTLSGLSGARRARMGMASEARVRSWDLDRHVRGLEGAMNYANARRPSAIAG